jgi:hypothetical protein
MAIDERSRHDLFARLEEVLGKEHATVLMEHLPPVGWADVATKRDLDQLANRLKHELRAEFHAELHAQTRTMVQWLILSVFGSTFTVGVLAFGAAHLV